MSNRCLPFRRVVFLAASCMLVSPFIGFAQPAPVIASYDFNDGPTDFGPEIQSPHATLSELYTNNVNLATEDGKLKTTGWSRPSLGFWMAFSITPEEGYGLQFTERDSIYLKIRMPAGANDFMRYVVRPLTYPVTLQAKDSTITLPPAEMEGLVALAVPAGYTEGPVQVELYISGGTILEPFPGPVYFDDIEIPVRTIPRLTLTSLDTPHPNPFSGRTTVEFELPMPGPVVIRAYDVAGREVGTLVDRDYPAGRHAIEWHAEGLSSGLYFIRIEAGGGSETQRVTLVR